MNSIPSETPEFVKIAEEHAANFIYDLEALVEEGAIPKDMSWQDIYLAACTTDKPTSLTVDLPDGEKVELEPYTDFASCSDCQIHAFLNSVKWNVLEGIKEAVSATQAPVKEK